MLQREPLCWEKQRTNDTHRPKRNRSGKSEHGSVAKLCKVELFTSALPINIIIIVLLGAGMGECNLMQIRGKNFEPIMSYSTWAAPFCSTRYWGLRSIMACVHSRYFCLYLDPHSGQLMRKVTFGKLPFLCACRRVCVDKHHLIHNNYWDFIHAFHNSEECTVTLQFAWDFPAFLLLFQTRSLISLFSYLRF